MSSINRLLFGKPSAAAEIQVELPASEPVLASSLQAQGLHLADLRLPLRRPPQEVPVHRLGNRLTTPTGQQFQLGQDLGKGAHGEVKLLRDCQSQAVYAAKIVPADDLEALKREGETAYTVRSPLTPLQILKTDHEAITVMALMSATMSQAAPLFRVFTLANRQLGFAHIAQQLLHQLSFMHQQGYAHQDIKPDNVMQRGGNFFLADFGQTYPVPMLRDASKKLGGGTMFYFSPEKFDAVVNAKDTAYDPQAADVWATGLALAKTCLGLYPRAGYAPDRAGSEAFNRDWRHWYSTGICPKGLRAFDAGLHQAGKPLRRLLLAMLHPDPHKRLTANQALARIPGLTQRVDPTLKTALAHHEGALGAQLGASLVNQPDSDRAAGVLSGLAVGLRQDAHVGAMPMRP